MRHVPMPQKKKHNHFEIENLLHAIEAINYAFAEKPVRLVSPRAFIRTKKKKAEDFHLETDLS